MKKVTYKIQGMHCASCAMNIDGELEDTPGVKAASASFARQLVEVEFDEEKVSPDQLVSAIKKAGYEATEALKK